MRTSIWRELAISATTDEREIRRAYARRLKIVHPEDNPEGFQALRAAFEQAMNHARHAAWEAENEWHEHEIGHAQTEPDTACVDQPHAPQPTTLSNAPQHQDPLLVAEVAQNQADRAEHQRLCDALSETLRQPQPNDEEVLLALLAILRSPALGALDVYDSTEHWLGQLAAQQGPGFNALLAPTIAFFRWDNRPVSNQWHPGLGALQHHANLGAIETLKHHASPHYKAFMVLSRPTGIRTQLQSRLAYGLKAPITELLAKLDYELPYLHAYLNPETVAWWRNFMSRPRLDASAFWAILLVTLLFGFFGWAGAQKEGVSITGLFVGAGLGFVVSLTAILALHYVIKVPRWRISLRQEPLPFWSALGWVPATAAFMTATAVASTLPISNTQVVTAMATLCGIGLCIWALIVTDRESWSLRLRFLFDGLSIIIPLGMITRFTLVDSPSLTVALVFALLILGIGGLHLARRWPVTPVASLQAGLLLAAMAGVSAALSFACLFFEISPIAIAALSIATAGCIIVAPHQSALMLGIRKWAIPILSFMLFTQLIEQRSLFMAWAGVCIGGILAVTTLGDLFLADRKNQKRKHPRSSTYFA